MLEIKNLSKSFGNQQVLDHISLKIEKRKSNCGYWSIGNW